MVTQQSVVEQCVPTSLAVYHLSFHSIFPSDSTKFFVVFQWTGGRGSVLKIRVFHFNIIVWQGFFSVCYHGVGVYVRKKCSYLSNFRLSFVIFEWTLWYWGLLADWFSCTAHFPQIFERELGVQLVLGHITKWLIVLVWLLLSSPG